MPYKILNKEKFRYAKKLRHRREKLKHTVGHILIPSNTSLQKIPANVQLSTNLVERANYWEILIPKNGEFGEYGEKDVKKLAKTLDAIAYLC